MPIYYTLQVQYGSSLKHETAEFKDMEFTEGTGKTESVWRHEIRQRLYTTGFTLETAIGTWEFISPLRVHTAYLIKQPNKHGT